MAVVRSVLHSPTLLVSQGLGRVAGKRLYLLAEMRDVGRLAAYLRYLCRARGHSAGVAALVWTGERGR